MKGVLDKFSGCKFVLKDLDDSIGNDKPREFSSASCLSDWLLCILFASLIEILCYRLKKNKPRVFGTIMSCKDMQDPNGTRKLNEVS